MRSVQGSTDAISKMQYNCYSVLLSVLLLGSHTPPVSGGTDAVSETLRRTDAVSRIAYAACWQ
eukprot:2557798-Rhodomonas_salina.2